MLWAKVAVSDQPVDPLMPAEIEPKPSIPSLAQTGLQWRGRGVAIFARQPQRSGTPHFGRQGGILNQISLALIPVPWPK